MKENDLGNLFVRHLVMAAPWGIMILIVMFIAAIGVKQNVKEGIQYAIRSSVKEAANFAFQYSVVVPVKQNIKEGVEFVAKTASKELREGFEFAAKSARQEIKALLSDPEVKQDLKEALEFGGQKFK
jgi:hypothetical protein